MINNTPLYIDLLDYLERDGIASLSNDFDPNAFMTNYDELDTTSPLINNPTVAPTMPYIIPPLGGDGGDGPRQGLESLRKDDDDVFDYEYDAYGIVDPFSMGVKGSPTIHEIGLAAADKERTRLRQVALEKAKAEATKRQAEAEAVREQRQKAADRSRQQYDPQNIGGGNYRSDRDNDRDGGYGGDSKRSEDNRSSDLGFSDIRLKENVELIGKSPSNINIYKFNYKDNPTTYQGTMAHEVPWASVKNSNGYMMVDYNQIDVEFKKI